MLTLLLMQPRLWFAFWAVSPHCWLMFSILSMTSPQTFSTGLLSVTYSPNLYSYLGLYQQSGTVPTAQHLVFRHIELHEILVGSPLRFVPLDGIVSFCCVLEDSFIRWKCFNSVRQHCSYQDIPWFSKICAAYFHFLLDFFFIFFVTGFDYAPQIKRKLCDPMSSFFHQHRLK